LKTKQDNFYSNKLFVHFINTVFTGPKALKILTDKGGKATLRNILQIIFVRNMIIQKFSTLLLGKYRRLVGAPLFRGRYQQIPMKIGKVRGNV
jgi:hypothetical protein